MQNIQRRGRKYEKRIERDYIDSLNTLYEEYFWNYGESPLLIINTENLDFVKNENHLKQIAIEISKHKKGRKIINFDFSKGLL
jgi:deoxyadenosine/deoxycytidine kinase